MFQMEILILELLAHPQFFLARRQGQSPPRLHKARVEVTGVKALNDTQPPPPP